MNRILIKGGRVIDPAVNADAVKDLKIEDGLIVEEFAGKSGIETVDASGLIVAPGLIDMHVHLREPGREDEETLESGAMAAAAGGFTAIACMPNTDPPVDNRSIVEYIADRAAGLPVDIKVIGAITAGRAGERLAEMGELSEAGVVGFSDDGNPVADSAVMRRAMEYSKIFDLPIISHAEDGRLAAGGVMHEGAVSTELGLKGAPAAAEDIIVARDIMLAELTGARLHITHVSTAGSVALIRSAKKRGLPVTADATPHHLVLTDENLKGYDANYKVNPPLRRQSDVEALRAGLADGTIDAIASDHAPHADYEKELEIENAPCGTIGLQTTLPVLLSYIAGREIDLPTLLRKLTWAPAGILKLKKGSLSPGSIADVTVIDPKAKVKIDNDYILSKSKNSAFLGSQLTGQAKYVLLAGRFTVKDGELIG